MRLRPFIGAAMVWGLAAVSAIAANPTPNPAEIARLRTLVNSIKPQTGVVTLPGGIAQLTLPADYRYLDPKDTDIILTDFWRNPREKHLGMILPPEFRLGGGNSWAVIIDYADDGHVADDDAASIDYTKLLADMKQASADANKERAKAGYDTAELVGWAEPPRYDGQTHKLYWAKDIHFDQQGSEPDTLNYNIRILGRKGVLNLNVVATMTQLGVVRQAAPRLIAMVDFTAGNRYADFDAHTDKMAAYGIAALVAGGIAAKAGLFKVILAGILAAKKFVIIAAIAIAGWFKRMFGRKSQS